MAAALGGVGVASADEPEAPALAADAGSAAEAEPAAEAGPAAEAAAAPAADETPSQDAATQEATGDAASTGAAGDALAAESASQDVVPDATQTRGKIPELEQFDGPWPLRAPIGGSTAAGVAGESNSVSYSTSGDIKLGEPAHKKSFAATGDGTGRISLTVQSGTKSVTETDPTDVIVVLDVSGSMVLPVENGPYVAMQVPRGYSLEDFPYAYYKYYGKVGDKYYKLTYHSNIWRYGWYYTNESGNEVSYDTSKGFYRKSTRLEVAKSALNSLAEKLIQNKDSKFSLRLVTFGNGIVEDGSALFAAGQADAFKNKVNGIDQQNYATNWEAGLYQANELADTTYRDNDGNVTHHDTYYVFISDGAPNLDKNGNYYNDEHYSPITKSPAYMKAVDEATGSNRHRPTNTKDIYTVYTGSEARSAMASFAGSVGKQTASKNAYDGTDPDSLNGALTSIVKSITKGQDYKSVTVKDTLSDYVEFGNFPATGDAADLSSLKPELKIGDTTYDLTDEKYKTALKIEGKTIKLDLSMFETKPSTPAGAKKTSLPEGTYTLSFNVHANQKAYDTAAKNAGDKDTYSLPTNADTTSSDGETKTSGATVTYKTVSRETDKDGKLTETESDPATVRYEQYPEIAVPVSKLTITKEWTGTSQPAKGDVIVTITDDTHGASTGVTFLPEGNQVTLKESETWTKTINVAAGPVGHTYTLDEPDAPAGWRKKSVENGEQVFTATTAITGRTTTVTNEPVPVSLTVTKVLKGAGADTTKPFKITVTKSTGETEFHDFVNGGTWSPEKLQLAWGDKVTVTEDTYAGYTQSNTHKVGTDGKEEKGESGTSTGEITLTGDTTVTFTNFKPLVPITGITSGDHGTTTLLGILAAVGVAIAGGFALVQSRMSAEVTGAHAGSRSWKLGLGRKSEPRHGRK